CWDMATLLTRGDGPYSTITQAGPRVNEKLAAAAGRNRGDGVLARSRRAALEFPCKRLAERGGFLNERETSDREPSRCLQPADWPQAPVYGVYGVTFQRASRVRFSLPAFLVAALALVPALRADEAKRGPGFDGEATWQVHLRFTPEEYAAMQPKSASWVPGLNKL